MNSINLDVIRREPAVLIGLLTAILFGVTQMAAEGKLTWATIIPFVGGVITRFFVSPAGQTDNDA